jgi:hypothetical protein
MITNKKKVGFLGRERNPKILCCAFWRAWAATGDLRVLMMFQIG